MTDPRQEMMSLIMQFARSGRVDFRQLGYLQVLVQASIALEIADMGGAIGEPSRLEAPPRLPTAAEALRSPSASPWVKAAIRRAFKGDMLAVRVDALLIAAVLEYEMSVSED
jgi:hypothetical protein